MDRIQEKAQQEQAKEQIVILRKAVEGLRPGSPEREAAAKKALDSMIQTINRDENRVAIWDFSAEKSRPVFASNDAITLQPVTVSDADFYVGIRMQYSRMYRGIVASRGNSLNQELLRFDLCQKKSFFCIADDCIACTHVGYIGIKDTGTPVWEIAIELDGQYTGRGFGPRCIGLFLNEVFRITGHTEFKALVDTGNVPSQKCFERIGARLIGLSDGTILKSEREKLQFEENNLNLITDAMRSLASRMNVEPRKLLSHVLEYRLFCPLQFY